MSTFCCSCLNLMFASHIELFNVLVTQSVEHRSHFENCITHCTVTVFSSFNALVSPRWGGTYNGLEHFCPRSQFDHCIIHSCNSASANISLILWTFFTLSLWLKSQSDDNNYLVKLDSLTILLNPVLICNCTFPFIKSCQLM